LEKHFARVPTNRILQQKKKLLTKKKYFSDRRIDTIFQIVVACCMICLFDRKILSAKLAGEAKHTYNMPKNEGYIVSIEMRSKAEM
jgi:hypothetical protein